MLDFNANQINAAAAGQVRFCPNCGGRNDADAKFCEVCGTKLPEMKAPVNNPFAAALEKAPEATPMPEVTPVPEVTPMPEMTAETAETTPTSETMTAVSEEKDAPVFAPVADTATETVQTETPIFEPAQEASAAPVFEPAQEAPAAPAFEPAQEAPAAPAFEPDPTPTPAPTMEAEEHKYGLALGLPEWTIEPPSMMVRRK